MIATPIQSRLNVIYLEPGQQGRDGEDVVLGLSQPLKTVPPKYFYDGRGSHLFEQICQLPEYYPTRTEMGILHQAAQEIVEITGACELVELGSGSSLKTRILLDAAQAKGQSLHYLPIDVSGSILKDSALALLNDYPNLAVTGIIGTYEQGLSHLPPRKLPERMISFLGSTLGNLTPGECEQFFQWIQASLKPQEYFLLGVDLVKPPKILEAAYNDGQGITAEFNLNLLAHLNWRFDGNFNLNAWQHRAIYNAQAQQIEMYLVSLASQQITLNALDFSCEFQPGELLHTEISRKFNLEQIQAQLRHHQLATVQAWTDEQNWFGVILAQRQS
ncbi:L-histidine N(alpha)-methyltransferase [Thermosynechococcaceae cyanobacterium BACA0444]|uniref:L-histidine N(Alpha)-methyltransferase n=1 Tax=Pseudocalidococcus azoricus BACA0444 TaxID=2918990 RepID=A0AAE4FS81_9CYAN|nr:L-histidine N(alpha)-methyltransferase [Pseudocalidococcus azoricus]MDS3861200.1 L-histidine N(alpha)-methyltransferase [Pseudocalidococcus azoricus BACA0444]